MLIKNDNSKISPESRTIKIYTNNYDSQCIKGLHIANYNHLYLLMRKKILESKFSSDTLYRISSLPKSYRDNVITKVERGEIKQSDIQAFISS